MRLFRRQNKIFISLSEQKVELIDVTETNTREFLTLTEKEFVNYGLTAIKKPIVTEEVK